MHNIFIYLFVIYDLCLASCIIYIIHSIIRDVDEQGRIHCRTIFSPWFPFIYFSFSLSHFFCIDPVSISPVAAVHEQTRDACVPFFFVSL